MSINTHADTVLSLVVGRALMINGFGLYTAFWDAVIQARIRKEIAPAALKTNRQKSVVLRAGGRDKRWATKFETSP